MVPLEKNTGKRGENPEIQAFARGGTRVAV
jgi:hypothetical protein